MQVQLPGVFGALAAEDVEFAVFHGPSVRIATPRDTVNNAVSTVATVLGQVFGGFFVEQGFVLCRGELEGDAFMDATELWLAHGVFVLGEVAHHIMPFEHQAALAVLLVRIHWGIRAARVLRGVGADGRAAGHADQCEGG